MLNLGLRARFDIFVASAALLAVLLHGVAAHFGIGAPTMLKAIAVASLMMSAGMTIVAVRALR